MNLTLPICLFLAESVALSLDPEQLVSRAEARLGRGESQASIPTILAVIIHGAMLL